MVLATPPTAPSRTRPATFSPESDAFFAWLVNTFHPELVALALSWGPGAPWGTTGGTAGAVTVATGLTLGGTPAQGQQVRFVGLNFNTAGATLKVDNLPAAPIHDPAGSAALANVIIPGRLFEATYVGTGWRVVASEASGSDGSQTVPLSLDANTLVTNGRYDVTGAANLPSGITTGLIVVDTRGANLVTQTLHVLNGSITSMITYWRVQGTGGAWSAWQERGLFDGRIGWMQGMNAGGAVTQPTSKATDVTLNEHCGKVTTAASSLAPGIAAFFNVNNSLMTEDYLPVIALNSGIGNYRIWTWNITAGSFGIAIENRHASSTLSDAILINFGLFQIAVN